ncbi:MAG TPA: hypothetical protein VK435_10760 [Thermodesulfovibrionales bacterium]|nr:hypothetical protein [Thermodesulfovibrionales bacterium]
MKRVWILTVAIVLVVMASASTVLAGNVHDPKIRERIARQQQKIDQGIISGSLTRREAAVLQDNLDWIRDEEVHLKRDGRLTDREKKRLWRMLDENSEMIHDKKHNRIRRYREMH